MLVSEELLRRFDVPGPRYTSYPTADRFDSRFDAAAYRRALAERSEGSVGGNAPLALYVHVPFCESLCYYCACNKIVTRHHERGREYIAALRKEIDLHAAELGRREPVSQVHFGGGSPTFLDDGELEAVMAALRCAFSVRASAEISIEVDPRTVSRARLVRLAGMGFNRISFGVQDFDEQVQRAVHRIQPFEGVFELMSEARARRFASINVDLIYGLPKQTSASFERTIMQVCRLRPDRVALYAYAHLPQRFKPQRRIHAEDLPPAGERVHMLSNAIAGFLSHGYTYIGMDHFALPTDELAIAKRQGRLQRNFQGYSTQPDSDIIGLGVSSIGRVGAHYAQNAKTLPEYYGAIDRGEFATQRGWTLDRDDIVRRAVIMSLMCHGEVDFEAIELAYMIDMRGYFAAEFERLAPLADAGLVDFEPRSLRITAQGWFFVRGISMVFDRYLDRDARRERFSRIV
jgi:oxygen-independent coproporphyrinogen-3 oxidase